MHEEKIQKVQSTWKKKEDFHLIQNKYIQEGPEGKVQKRRLRLKQKEDKVLD
jgi:hypothetical protein